MEYTVRLKAARDEKSALAGSEFHTVKILQDIFLEYYKSFAECMLCNVISGICVAAEPKVIRRR